MIIVYNVGHGKQLSGDFPRFSADCLLRPTEVEVTFLSRGSLLPMIKRVMLNTTIVWTSGMDLE